MSPDLPVSLTDVFVSPKPGTSESDNNRITMGGDAMYTPSGDLVALVAASTPQ